MLPIRVWLWVLRLFTNTIVFLSLAGTSYAIYLAVDSAESRVHNSDFHQAFSGGMKGMKLFLASFMVRKYIPTVHTLLNPSTMRLALRGVSISEVDFILKL